MRERFCPGGGKGVLAGGGGKRYGPCRRSVHAAWLPVRGKGEGEAPRMGQGGANVWILPVLEKKTRIWGIRKASLESNGVMRFQGKKSGRLSRKTLPSLLRGHQGCLR